VKSVVNKRVKTTSTDRVSTYAATQAAKLLALNEVHAAEAAVRAADARIKAARSVYRTAVIADSKALVRLPIPPVSTPAERLSEIIAEQAVKPLTPDAIEILAMPPELDEPNGTLTASFKHSDPLDALLAEAAEVPPEDDEIAALRALPDHYDTTSFGRLVLAADLD
jgi:hypothetical protein